MRERKGEANYLERKPARPKSLEWSKEGEGLVVLHVENTGIFNRIAQRLLHKPRVSFVHLDKFGSFVWLLLDGETDILGLGRRVEEEFGEAASPLYPRLAKFFQILDSYHFIEWAQ